MISPYRLTSLFPPDTRQTTFSPGRTATTDRSAAVASAPAGSAMTPSVWYSSSISVQTSPSGTVTSSAPLRPTSGSVTSPARRTAAPSTNVSSSGSVTGSPAAIAAAMHAAPAGSTPTTRPSGGRVTTQVETPASTPPPPTGTPSTPGGPPNCSTSSPP